MRHFSLFDTLLANHGYMHDTYNFMAKLRFCLRFLKQSISFAKVVLLTTHKDFHLNLKYKVNGFNSKLDLIEGKRFIAVAISTMTLVPLISILNCVTI